MADTPPKPIEDELQQLEKDSADQQEEIRKETDKGKLLAGLISDLKPIATKKEQSVASYEGKHDDLAQRWQGQKAKLDRFKTDIIAVFPNWADLINNKVCGIINDINNQRTTVGNLAPPKGPKEGAAASAKAAVDASKARLDAWFAADARLAAQLTQIDKGINDLQAVFGGAEQIFAIYLLWFKLLPQLQEIAPRNGATAADAGAPKCLPVPDPDAVYLISPDDYPGQLDKAWQAYRAAREAFNAADAAFKAEPDDLATETKTLTDMIAKQDDAAKKALISP